MSEPALRVIAGGERGARTPARRGIGLLLGAGAALAGASVLLEHVRATRGGLANDLALLLLLACSVTVIVGAMRRYDGALKVWAAAATAHVIAALTSFVYFHLVVFEQFPTPLRRWPLLKLQLRVLVGFVFVVGVVCMIASAVRKAVRAGASG